MASESSNISGNNDAGRKKSPARAPSSGRRSIEAPVPPDKPVSEKSATPSDRVYDYILDKILTREWPVNSKILTEPELCGELKVSRMAVREAVERLSALGLLMKRQGSGTFVTQPRIDTYFRSMFPMIMTNEKDVRQILEFRRHFEYGNVLLFMDYADPRDIEALERNYATMVSLPASESDKSGSLDFEFHQLIARGTKNQFIIRTSDILIEIMRTHQAVIYYTAATQGNAIIYHNEIIRAIKNGDGEVAAMLMRRHIDIAIEYFDKNWIAAEFRNRRDNDAGPTGP